MGAVPKDFNLGLEKPVTVPAYGRQVQSIATNAQTFGANTIANIVIDTSTAGSFLDPLQSLLEFDIEITNTNPHIDYLNFGAAGAASLIQEFRIYNQGTPLVEIHDYNLAFETWMKLGNMQQQEFAMYMENSWRAPVAPGESDLNFVKPPMIDLNGVIMWPTNVNLYADKNQAAKKSIGHYLANIDETITPAENNGNFFPATNGVNYNATLATYEYLPSITAKSPGQGVLPCVEAASSNIFLDPAEDFMNTYIEASEAPWNYTHNYTINDANYTYSDAPGTINSWTWTNRIDNTYVTWPSTIRPENTEFNAGIKMQEQAVKNYRLEDYMMYLSNVKNIPVGVSPLKSFIGTESAAITKQTGNFDTTDVYSNETLISNWNLTNETTSELNAASDTTKAGSFKYHVCLPFFDGLLGMGAEKQFPTMLISPGSLYIQIRWAKMEQAVQATMDPCRRIFGTYRDYVPNIGLKSYYATEYKGQVLRSDRQTVNYINNSVFPTTFMAYTPHAARGTDFAWKGILPIFPPTAIDLDVDRLNLVSKNGYRTNVFTNQYSANFDYRALFGSSFVDATSKPAKRISNSTGFNEGLSTGLPKPQYVPITKPWLYSGNLFHYTGTMPSYCKEYDVCYGTYLPRSTPQVRRTTTKAYPGENISPTNISAVPTYVINNLKYTGYQTILSDELTGAILKASAKEDISVYGQTWKTYRTVCSNSEAQTIILPIKVSSANSLHFLFQNETMRENLNYNSLTGNCPLTHFKWTTDTDHFVGSDTAPTFTGLETTGSNMSIQLAIGNELLPQQPITSVTNLVSELERSIHAKGQMTIPIQARTTLFGNKTGSVTNKFGSLVNHDFMAPYVPVEALDDQTITDNPAFMDYLAQDYETFRSRGNYGTGLFTPPESDFILGFDLDNFPGNNDNARSGRYLGNAPLTLRMSGAKALASSSLSTLVNNLDAWSCIVIVLLDIRFSIGAGGSIQTFY